MRRPRYKLQVSTFPFLAVLLCAMGSLLLFLFIMDRRAKIAAQHMNEEALQARKQHTKDEEDKLQADWEKAKEKLHQALLLQQGQLTAQAQGLQIDLESAGKKLQLIQTQHLELDEQAKAEAAKITEIQFQIAGRRAGLLEADKQETMSKKELLAAAQELAELEIAFQQLLAVKEREKQVHSLVPYHGKRGDSRTPIYVECVRDGVVFHPDDRLLQGYEFTPGSIRFEVERRAGTLTPAKPSDAKLPAEEKKGVYVLFLVRPSGIGSYYRAQAALKTFRLDFGYELIDQDWELDFGGAGYAKNGPASLPARRTEMPIDTRPRIEPPTPIDAGTGPLPPPGIGPPATGFGQGPPVIPGLGGPGGVLGFGGGSGDPPGIGAPMGGGSGKGPAFVPLNKILPPVPIASTEGPGNGQPGFPGGGAGPYPSSGTQYPGGGTGPYPSGGQPGFPGGGAGPYPSGGTPNPGSGTEPNPSGGTRSPNGSAPGAGQNPAGTGNGNPNGGGTPANGNSTGNVNAPATSYPNVGGQNPSAGLAGQGAPGTGAPNANGSAGEPGAARDGGGVPIGPPPSSFGGGANTAKTVKKAAPTSAITNMLGNKDFVITVDCYSDHVNVFPGGMSFRWTAATMKTTDEAFAQAVANLIERRQASVRPGEPPYRPMISFRVTPDGRPSCLHVYPLLEPLHVPMTRENVVE